jgi:transcriptional regulator with PAS, ATPase and Fis domain
MKQGSKRRPGPVRAGDPIAAAIEETSGAALVLDDELRVVVATPAAEELLGFRVPLGASAPRLLCGEGLDRPIAEALAAGRAAQAVVPRPTHDDPGRMVRVRATPVGHAGQRAGWLLFLEQATGAAAEGAVRFQGMWTQHDSMKRLFRVLERVAAVDASVLVRGETGAGKELVAHALHALSPRHAGPFRVINCAALPPNLLESELFGHVRGAFTGAVKDTPGHVQMAHGGTLFLDEVGELPLELQAKLLRVLEERTVLPVGGRTPIPVDVRLVSATHRSLRQAVEEGCFRADLMFRLRVIPVLLPPLRARRGDVKLLAETFLEEHNARGRRRVDHIAPATQRILDTYAWPGNVRELRNVMEYAFVIGDGPVLSPGDLPVELSDPGSADLGTAPRPVSEDVRPEARRILAALERSAGSRERAAQILGISRITLWRRMKDLGLVPAPPAAP